MKSARDITIWGSGESLLAGTGTIIANSEGTAKSIHMYGTLSAGDVAGSIGTLSVGEATSETKLLLHPTSILRVDTTESGAADHIHVRGDVSVTETGSRIFSVDLGSLNNVSQAAIITASGTVSVRPSNLSAMNITLNGVDIALLSDRVTGNARVTSSMDGKSLLLTTTFTAQSEKMLWAGADDDSWNMIEEKWSDMNGLTPKKFLAGDWATFDSTSSKTINVAPGGVTASQMDVTGGDWTFNGNIVVNKDAWVGTPPAGDAPDGKLHISGSAGVTLDGVNSFLDGIDIEDGTLTLRSDTAAGTGRIDIASGSGLRIDYAGNFDSEITGSGDITKISDGVLNVQRSIGHSGRFIVNAGTVKAEGENFLGNGVSYDLKGTAVLDFGDHDQAIARLNGESGTRVEMGTGSMHINGANASVYGGVIHGSGKVVLGSGARLTLTGENTYTGGTELNNATLEIGDGGTGGGIIGSIHMNNIGSSEVVFNRSDDASYSGTISGTGNVTKRGSGTFTLTGNMTHTGDNVLTGLTTVSAGTLIIGDGGTSGSVSGDIINNATVAFNRSDTVSYSKSISGSGGVEMIGTGTLVLTGDNTYNGLTTVSSGTLQIGNGNVAGSITSDIVNRSVVVFDNTLDITFNNIISGPGTVFKKGSGTLIITSHNDYTGDTIVEGGGTIQFGRNNAVGSVVGNIRLADGSSVSFESSGDMEYAGTISGNGNVTHSGDGTVILTGENDNDGKTTIGQGQLQIGDGGTSGSVSENIVNRGTVVFNRSDDSSTHYSLTGFGLYINRGTGTTTIKSMLPSVRFSVENGAFHFIHTGDLDFTNRIEGSGTLAYTLSQTDNSLTFGSTTAGFTGTIQMKKGTIDLNGANTETLFTNATLKLTSSEATGTLNDNQTLKGLTFDGGTLKIASTTGQILPTAHLTVTDLDITSQGGTLAMNIDGGIDTSVAEYGSFYDYAGSSQASQQAVVAVTGSVAGANTQLGLTRYDGTAPASSPVARSISDGSGTVGTARFDYLATVIDSGAKKGVYLGYGLKSLEAVSGKTIVLDSDDATGDTAVMNAVLTGSGGYAFTGSKKTHVGNSASDYTGVTTIDTAAVTMLTDLAFGNTSGLDLKNSASLDMNGKDQTVGELAGDAGTAITLGTLTVNQTSASEYKGALSGAGKLIKRASGTLTLSGTVANAGGITVEQGTIALAGPGAVTSPAGIRMAGGTTLDISAVAAATTSLSALNLSGKNAAVVANGKTLDLSNASLAFDLTGVNAGDTVLAADGGLRIGDDTTLTITNVANDLKKDDRIKLVHSLAAGSSTDTTGEIQVGRKKLFLELDSQNLYAVISGIASFSDAAADYLGTAANGNTQSGNAYLDWLQNRPFGETDGMDILEDYFSAITVELPAEPGASEMQRFFGAYSAYANQAVTVDADRFRQRWRQQSHAFLDGLVFADLLSDASISSPVAGSGVASSFGLASPVYGVRQCVPAGNAHFWASGFGSWAEQDSRTGFAGNKYQSYGLAVGFDYTRDRLRLGVAGAYSRGDLKVRDLGYKNEADVINVALYAAYVHESGLYAEGGIGYGRGWNNYDVDMLLNNGRKSGKFASHVVSADLEVGYIARLPRNVNLVPSVGMEFSHQRNGSWTEAVTGNPALPANRFQSGRDNSLDIPVGLRANKVFRLGSSGSHIIPELRAAYVCTANRSRPSIESGFTNAPGGPVMRGVDTGSSHWRFGAGLTGRVTDRIDFRLDYEFQTRSGYKGHTMNASVGIAF